MDSIIKENADVAQGPDSVKEIVERLSSLGSENDRVSVNEVVESFGGRSYGPSLLVPALVGASPVGGVPGVPSFFAALIMVFAVQILIGRTHFWLPGILAERSVSGDKLDEASKRLEAPGRKLDSIFHGRLSWATRRPFTQVAALFIVLLCATIPPLEIIPLAAALPFSAIAAFGLAMMVRDGALMLVATAVSCASLGFGVMQIFA